MSDSSSTVPKAKSWKYKLNQFQQRHKTLAFSYSVQKKYGDDNAGYQAALLTYYGFLSIFPLLFVALSLSQLTFFHSVQFQNKITEVMNHYFPLIGSQLEKNIHVHNKAGLALVISLLITFYGARGIASVFQYVANQIWEIPKQKRSSGLKASLQSIGIILVGGIGFILTTVVSTFATSLGHVIVFRILAILISLILVFLILLMIFNLALSSLVKIKDLIIAGIIAAIGLQIIQLLGGFLITRELSRLSSLYGSFALVIGILFWIYLQSRVLMYAIETNTVKKLALWPRSLTSDQLTTADKKAFKLYAERERLTANPPEDIGVKFEPVRLSKLK